MKNLKPVNHQNIVSDSGRVYCKKLGKVINLDYKDCNTCDYCFGSLQGQGVECMWEDSINNQSSIVTVTNPNKEFLRVSKLIDDGIIKKG